MISNIQKDFLLFCRNMEPAFTFAEAHKFVCNKVQNSVNEHNGRLLLSISPGFGKSTICSRMLPAYLLGIDPTAKILLLTYGATLSNLHGKGARKYMETPQYKKIFPSTSIVGSGVSGSFETSAGGSLTSIGRGGSITGRRANYIILDDTIKNQQEAQSDTIIENLHNWFSTVAYSRLLPGGSLVAFNTRWCENDLIGFILNNYKKPNGEDWEYINLPAISDNSLGPDPLGRSDGLSLWEEFYPLTTLLQIKSATPSTFSALYQGNPTSNEAVPIKEASIRSAYIDTYDKSEYPKLITSWDTASTQDSGDYTVATTWAISKTGGKAVLINVARAQVDFPGLIDLFNNIDNKFKPNINIIENASSGRQLIQILEPEQTLASSTIKSNDKVLLAESFNASLLTGKIKLLNGCLSLTDEQELKSYPYGSHDDLCLSALHFYKNLLDNTNLYNCKRYDAGLNTYKSVLYLSANIHKQKRTYQALRPSRYDLL